jgi:hypothetical protein
MCIPVCDVVSGNWDSVSEDTRRFVNCACACLNGLREICVVDELGYPDVWLVFGDLTETQKDEAIRTSLEVHREFRPCDFSFMVWTHEEFAHYDGTPLLRLRVGAH